MSIIVIGLSGESVFCQVDHFNKKEETISIEDIIIEPGGKGYNQAYALSTITNRVSFITAFGNTYLQEMKKPLRNLKLYPIFKNARSNYAVIQTDKLAQNNVMVYRSVDITLEDIKKYRDIILEHDCILIQLELSKEVVEYIIDIAHEFNKLIILNPAPCNYIPSNIHKVNILTPNEFEKEQLEKTNYSFINQKVITTRGSSSIEYQFNDTIKSFDIIKVKPVDTTGAGDVFNAFLAYFIQKEEIEVAIKKASIASTLSVLKKGVIRSIPSLLDVELLYIENKLINKYMK